MISSTMIVESEDTLHRYNCGLCSGLLFDKNYNLTKRIPKLANEVERLRFESRNEKRKVAYLILDRDFNIIGRGINSENPSPSDHAEPVALRSVKTDQKNRIWGVFGSLAPCRPCAEKLHYHDIKFVGINCVYKNGIDGIIYLISVGTEVWTFDRVGAFVRLRSLGDLASIIVGYPGHAHFAPPLELGYIATHESSLKALLKSRCECREQDTGSVLQKIELQKIDSQIEVELQCLRSATEGNPLRRMP